MINDENLEIMNEILEEEAIKDQNINKLNVFLAATLGGIIGYKYL